jgi:hypothetical protein
LVNPKSKIVRLNFDRLSYRAHAEVQNPKLVGSFLRLRCEDNLGIRWHPWLGEPIGIVEADFDAKNLLNPVFPEINRIVWANYLDLK